MQGVCFVVQLDGDDTCQIAIIAIAVELLSKL
jgi:hypothetical protein